MRRIGVIKHMLSARHYVKRREQDERMEMSIAITREKKNWDGKEGEEPKRRGPEQSVDKQKERGRKGELSNVPSGAFQPFGRSIPLLRPKSC